MFVRIASMYCFSLLVASTLLAPSATAQWKTAENSPAAEAPATEGESGDDVKFRPSPRFQTLQLPAPVDSTANGPVAPVSFSLPLPAVRGQEGASSPAVISQGSPSHNTSLVTYLAPANAPMHQAVVQASAVQPLQQAANFTSGNGSLPNQHGQIWREYDISPYTLRVHNVPQPEQAVIDWIIRETGTQVWFSEPLGVLSANRTTLRVYHTPEMQTIVKNLVDQFVAGPPDAYGFGVRLLTVNNPNWRESLHRIMRPVSVQTPGIQAWIMSKEDASLFVNELSKRTDYREYASTDLAIHNGQAGELTYVKPTSYIKNVLFSDAFGSYQPEQGEIRQGYNLSISPLISGDGSVVDCVIKCKVDQVEQLVDVNIDVPTQLNPGQQVQVQVPQLVSWRVHERFRWPADQVLVVSCGVVAKPGGTKRGLLGMRNVPNPFEGAPRADAMMILEAKGAVAAPLAQQTTPGGNPAAPAFQTGAVTNHHGRY